MRQITKDINKLKEDDLISIILYCMYKFTDDPEYAIISELAYTLDKDSMYKLCATFGGTTIKIPTLEEYKKMVKVMLIFDYINREGLTFSEACEKSGVDNSSIGEITKMYSVVSGVIDLYEE